MKRKRKMKVSSVIIYLVLILMALSCLLPMLNAIFRLHCSASPFNHKEPWNYSVEADQITLNLCG